MAFPIPGNPSAARRWVPLLVLLLTTGCAELERATGPMRPLQLPELTAGAPVQQLTARGSQSGPLLPARSPARFTRLGSGDTPGPLVAQGGTPPGGPPSAATRFTLNFVEVDVAEVARVILGDMLGVPFVIDPRVRGPVTVEASTGVPAAALIPTLQAALRSQGAGLIEGPQGFEIVPAAEARRQASALGRGTTGILPIAPRFASAADMLRALQPLLNDEVTATADQARNLIVISGEQRQIAQLGGLVRALDTDVMAGRSFGLYPLRNASAAAVVDELQAVFGGTGGLRFLPIARQNSVLVVATQPAALRRAAEWITDLDRAGGSDELQVYVYQVEYGRATDLARVLSRLFGSAGGDGERGGQRQGEVVPGLASLRVAGGDPLGAGGGGEAGGFQASPLGGSQGNPLGGALGGGRPGGGGAGAPSSPDGGFASGPEPETLTQPRGGADPMAPRIVADPNSNTVVVQAISADWTRIEAALRRLDQVPLQVLIEATIAEVTLNDRLRFGLQVALRSGNFSVGLNPSASPDQNDGILPGLFGQIALGGNSRVVLDALSGITNVNVISSPQLMVLSNQTATLQVGDQVPIATQSATSLDVANGRVVNSIQLRDTGVILRVTPRVNSSGLIGMDIEQEVSDVVPTDTSRIDSPTIRQRRVRSTVAVQSGETVALGGLIRSTVDQRRSGIPGLRDIPVLGALLGSTEANDGRTELLVLITPRIVRNSEEARALTAELRSRLRGLDPPSGRRPAR